MTRLSNLILLFIFMSFFMFATVQYSFSGSERDKNSDARKTQKVKGVSVERNKVTAKKGYKLRVVKADTSRRQPNDLILVQNDSGDTTGSFVCKCSKNGHCAADGTPDETSVVCTSTNCTGNCTISITIDPPTAPEPE